MNPELSAPAINLPVYLKTDRAQRMVALLIPRIDGIFFMLEFVYSKHKVVGQQTQKASQEILQKFSNLIESIDAFINEQPPFDKKDPTLSYTWPRTITLQCRTLNACCCGEILLQYDRLAQGYVPANSCIAYSLCLQGYRRAL